MGAGADILLNRGTLFDPALSALLLPGPSRPLHPRSGNRRHREGPLFSIPFRNSPASAPMAIR